MMPFTSPFKQVHFLLLAIAWGMFASASAQIPSGFIRERMATGLNPTSMLIAPDGRIFITEKHGSIRIIRDQQLLAEPFLTLEVDDSNERGLGHMVLHPDFEQNGYFYVYYSVHGLRYNRISRFTANGDKTIPGSEHIILNLDQLAADVHNGGDMIFGLDGFLYISTGEGGQYWLSEHPTSTNGKVLRVDEYGHPVPDNPWYTGLQRSNLAYAYGLRNPFTMTMHPVSGDIYINDVGGAKFEEVNRLVRGAFYGWPRVEGKRTSETVPDEYLDPVYQYAHTGGYCAIVGSTFYVPEVQQFPEQYRGRYFYSDYCTGKIRMLDVSTGVDRGVFIHDGDRVIDLDVSPDGSFFYLERKGIGNGSAEDNTGTNEGTLWKVTYTGSGAPFISIQPQSHLASAGEDASFTVLASGAGPLTYTWLINDEVWTTADGPTLLLTQVQLEMDSAVVQVEIRNDLGTKLSDKVLLRITANHRPSPEIILPPPGSTYRGGGTLHFSGVAEDLEEGILPGEALAWRIDFHHGSHTHPAMPWTSGESEGEWTIPSIGETSAEVWYRIYLKATDLEGLSQLTYRDVFPESGQIHVITQTEGLVVHLDGIPMSTPFHIEGVRGISRFISPPYKQVLGDSVYFFKGWSDGETSIHREVKTDENNQIFKPDFEAIRNGRGYGVTVSYYDNQTFDGEPVATTIDTTLDNQYLFSSPYPGVPEDDFSIRWKGYIQPYRTGIYHFSMLSDDGAFMEIDGQVLMQNWEPGVHFEKGSIFLEEGRLYPIHLRLYEWAWGAQLRLRWSCDDFPEEPIPVSQLYPEDYLSDRNVSGILSMEVITKDGFQVLTESFRDVIMDFSIVTMDGRRINFPGFLIPIGKHIHRIDIGRLPQGMYYFQGLDVKTGEKILTPFVKVN